MVINTMKYVQRDQNNRYRYRRGIPQRLRILFNGNREFVKVIGKTEEEALKNFPAIHSHFDKQLKSAAALIPKTSKSTTPSPDQIAEAIEKLGFRAEAPETEEEYQARPAEFMQILPFTPSNKPNLVAWLASRSDAAHYGELVAFNFPRDRQVFGPSQIEARIDNDTYISQQFTLWGQAGSTVIRGNLLTVPLGDSLLYIEPVYLQAENLNLPELKQVILATSTQVVMRPTLSEAIDALLPEDTSVPSSTKSTTATSKDDAADGSISVGNLKDLRDQVAVLEKEFDTLLEVINSLQANNDK